MRRSSGGRCRGEGNRSDIKCGTGNETKRFEMKIHLAVVFGLAMAGSVLTAQAGGSLDPMAPAAPSVAKEHVAAMMQPVYVCPDCEMMAMKAGKCAMCGKDMMPSHVLGIKDGKAMVCGCGAGCNCDAKSMKDGKCGCGKDVGKASLKGLYVCPAGCPVFSDKPGNCGGCGKMMKKCE